MKEVEKARANLLKLDHEKKLTTKWGMILKHKIDVGSAQVPDAVSYLDFRLAKLAWGRRRSSCGPPSCTLTLKRLLAAAAPVA